MSQESTERLDARIKNPSLEVHPSSTRGASQTRSGSRSRGGSRSPGVSRIPATVPAPPNPPPFSRGGLFARLSPPLTRQAKRKREEELILMELANPPRLMAPEALRPIAVILEDTSAPREGDNLMQALDSLAANSGANPQPDEETRDNTGSQESAENGRTEPPRKKKRVAIRTRQSVRTTSTTDPVEDSPSNGAASETQEEDHK